MLSLGLPYLSLLGAIGKRNYLDSALIIEINLLNLPQKKRMKNKFLGKMIFFWENSYLRIFNPLEIILNNLINF